ncbi:hypothetical protein HMPREF0581_1256 [Mogibacterium timidum ATCC 33093]|uniref:Uncharacterized protein n=1 Tax=Mogibacterium timidum ATCC 33093 TaxID=1401079 RepID=X8JA39_9FIRM|nr:hypothetical protein HMPREF0581_1256 [Mogibacterium timidum ATCC 33093]
MKFFKGFYSFIRTGRVPNPTLLPIVATFYSYTTLSNMLKSLILPHFAIFDGLEYTRLFVREKI